MPILAPFQRTDGIASAAKVNQGCVARGLPSVSQAAADTVSR